MIHVLIFLIVIILMVLLLIAFNTYMAYHWHRCVYCGRRMVHTHSRKTASDTVHIFHCTHCGAWEEVKEEALINPL